MTAVIQCCFLACDLHGPHLSVLDLTCLLYGEVTRTTMNIFFLFNKNHQRKKQTYNSMMSSRFNTFNNASLWIYPAVHTGRCNRYFCVLIGPHPLPLVQTQTQGTLQKEKSPVATRANHHQRFWVQARLLESQSSCCHLSSTIPHTS